MHICRNASKEATFHGRFRNRSNIQNIYLVNINFDESRIEFIYYCFFEIYSFIHLIIVVLKFNSKDNVLSIKENNEVVDINEIVKQTTEEFISANLSADIYSDAPKSSNIYISTKTKIAYLNTPIDLKLIFWQVSRIKANLDKELKATSQRAARPAPQMSTTATEMIYNNRH
jgi:hypothetical protein